MRKWVTNDQEVSRNSIRPTHILIIKTLDWILPANGHEQPGRAHITVFKNWIEGQNPYERRKSFISRRFQRRLSVALSSVSLQVLEALILILPGASRTGSILTLSKRFKCKTK